MATGKQHPQPAHLLKFLARPDTTPGYIKRTAEWLRTEYPGSAPQMLPELRRLYRAAIRRGGE